MVRKGSTDRLDDRSPTHSLGPFGEPLMTTLDPTLHWIARIALTVLLALAAVHKLRDRNAFALTLAGYRLVPESMVAFLSPSLGLTEAALALSLALAWAPSATALATMALLAI